MAATPITYDLDQKMTAYREGAGGGNVFVDLYQEVSPELRGGIRDKFVTRPYQQEALGRLRHYLERFNAAQADGSYRYPNHVLFNLATGSGKTLLMAETILYLYLQGYRNFLFVTRLDNVVQKTVDNLLNASSSKGYYCPNIVLDSRPVRLREVRTFGNTEEGVINLRFSTLGALHYEFNNPSENGLTFEGLQGLGEPTVILADEAHNLNAYTKVAKKDAATLTGQTEYDTAKLNKTETETFQGWEGTIRKILQTHPKNLLLEYTATIPQKAEVQAKYDDKVLMQYDIRDYRADGYAKHPQMQSSASTGLERALLGTLSSYYRQHFAQARGIRLKPVLLLKANRAAQTKTFNEDKDVLATDFIHEYGRAVGGFGSREYRELRAKFGAEEYYAQMFAYLDTLEEGFLAHEIRTEFAQEKCLLALAKKGQGDDLAIWLNTLEEFTNPYRVVVTVETLNEGWDVLNLYDIVRLYETSSTSSTVAEAQLIGRGVRLNPFVDPANPEADPYVRKYDEQDATILETLYFHARNDSKYLASLRKELDKIGLSESYTYTFKIKEEFQNSKFWRSAKVFANERRERSANDAHALDLYRAECARAKQEPVVSVFSYQEHGRRSGILTSANSNKRQTKHTALVITEYFELKLLLEAMDRAGIDYAYLRRNFPSCQDRREFLLAYCRGLKIRLQTEAERLPVSIRLRAAVEFFRALQKIIAKHTFTHYGTKEQRV